MSTENYSEDYQFTSEELAQMDAAQRESEKHQFDHVDPFEKLESVLGAVEEAKGWLEQSAKELIEADGAAEGCEMKDFCAGLDLLRVAIGQAIAAISAVQPNSYLAEQLRKYRQDQDCAEAAFDAQS